MRILLAAFLLLNTTALMGQSTTLTEVGEVSFANSGAPAAQGDFLRGLAQLHNFEYEDAAKHFRRAEEIDPNFAMAYWGEAMTKNHGIWHEQDLAAARGLLSRLAATPEARQAKAPTAREKLYLASLEILYGEGTKEERDLAYVAAMAQLHNQYPDDIDATAFYALAIISSAEHGRDFATYMRAAAVLEEVFPQHSHHPGVVHYLIHSYDDPIHAPLGLRPARIYAQLAPEAAHAQHMTSHIFLALGMWEDVVKANETAMAVVNRQRQAAGKPPGFCGHYNYWLEYGYLQQGRVADARRILEGCFQQAKNQAEELAAKTKASSATSPSTGLIDSYADMRANFLIDSELWKDDVTRWKLPAGDFPFAQLTLDYTDGLIAWRTADLNAAREALSRAEADLKLARARLTEEKKDNPVETSEMAVLVDQLRALITSQKPGVSEMIEALKSVASKENALPLEFGPPVIYKPTEELLGELYLETNRPAEAQKSFEADLARAPGRRLGKRGLLQAQHQLTSAKNEVNAATPIANSESVHH